MKCESCRRWGNRRRELNRRAANAGAAGRVDTTDDLIAAVFAHGSQCHWCDQPLDFVRVKAQRHNFGDATLDHVVDLQLGGSGLVANIVPACHACNRLRALVASRSPAHTVRSVAGMLGRLDVLPSLLLSYAGDDAAREGV